MAEAKLQFLKLNHYMVWQDTFNKARDVYDKNAGNSVQEYFREAAPMIWTLALIEKLESKEVAVGAAASLNECLNVANKQTRMLPATTFKIKSAEDLWDVVNDFSERNDYGREADAQLNVLNETMVIAEQCWIANYLREPHALRIGSANGVVIRKYLLILAKHHSNSFPLVFRDPFEILAEVKAMLAHNEEDQETQSFKTTLPNTTTNTNTNNNPSLGRSMFGRPIVPLDWREAKSAYQTVVPPTTMTGPNNNTKSTLTGGGRFRSIYRQPAVGPATRTAKFSVIGGGRFRAIVFQPARSLRYGH
jgi:hypothetical protein